MVQYIYVGTLYVPIHHVATLFQGIASGTEPYWLLTYCSLTCLDIMSGFIFSRRRIQTVTPLLAPGSCTVI